jgi:hypothetical protein
MNTNGGTESVCLPIRIHKPKLIQRCGLCLKTGHERRNCPIHLIYSSNSKVETKGEIQMLINGLGGHYANW